MKKVGLSCRGNLLAALATAMAMALWLVTGNAFAQAAVNVTAPLAGARYGVLSLIGDRLYVVTKQPPTAAQPESFQKIDLILPAAVFDEFVLKSVDGLIKRAIPDANIKLLAVNEPKLFMRQTDLIDAGASLASLLPAVRDATASTAIDKLVLITKFPDQAHVKMGKSALAAGNFFGLGFYSDDSQASPASVPAPGPAPSTPAVLAAKSSRRADKTSSPPAFVAPYVYIQVLLIDIKTWTVLKQETTAVATIRVVAPIAKAKDSNPTALSPSSAYDAMSGQDKVATISKMLDYELSVMVPKLLAK